MTISPSDALDELGKIRVDLDTINQKSFRFYQKAKKREEIRILVDMLDIVLQSVDPDYEKGDILEKTPSPTTLRTSGLGVDVGDQEIEASSDKWSKFLENQLNIYEKRVELLAKSFPLENKRKEISKQSGQIIGNIEKFINYNHVVNITSITNHIDQVILELDNEPNLDPIKKEEIKSKLQKAKDFIKNASDETTPLAGKFVGQALRSFLFGNES